MFTNKRATKNDRSAHKKPLEQILEQSRTLKQENNWAKSSQLLDKVEK